MDRAVFALQLVLLAATLPSAPSLVLPQTKSEGVDSISVDSLDFLDVGPIVDVAPIPVTTASPAPLAYGDADADPPAAAPAAKPQAPPKQWLPSHWYQVTTPTPFQRRPFTAYPNNGMAPNKPSILQSMGGPPSFHQMAPPPLGFSAGLVRPQAPPPLGFSAGIVRPQAPPPLGFSAGIVRPQAPPLGFSAAIVRPQAPPPLGFSAGIVRQPPTGPSLSAGFRPQAPSLAPIGSFQRFRP